MWSGLARTAVAASLVMFGLGACRDGQDAERAAVTTTTTSTAPPRNVLQIEMVDHAYKLQGPLRPGLATISSTNTGTEWHMAGFGKLKPDRTLDDVVKALQARADSAGGIGEEDPTMEFVEKDLGTPGHILQPGQSQSISLDLLEPGSYVVRCFLPTEGESTLHLDKGMVAGFEVAGEKAVAGPPEEDATIVLPDEADPTGVPTDLKAGQRTFKITASGTRDKDLTIGQITSGEPFEVFDAYFQTEFDKEGGPAKGAAAKAPGTILASTFAIAPDQTVWITADLVAGDTYFVGTTNPAEDPEQEGIDKFVKVTVT